MREQSYSPTEYAYTWLDNTLLNLATLKANLGISPEISPETNLETSPETTSEATLEAILGATPEMFSST